jgi:hypothetical protein
MSEARNVIIAAIVAGLVTCTAVAQSTVTTSGGTANTVPVYTGSSTVGNSVITQAGSNVGIGTSSPATLLEVNGGTQVDGTLQVGNGTKAASLLLQDVSGANWTLGTGNDILNFTDSTGTKVLSLCDSGSACNGRIGVGTTDPEAELDIRLTTNPAGGGPTMGLNVYNTVTTGSSTDYPQNHVQSSYTGSTTQLFLYGQADSVYQSGTGTLSNAYAGFFRVENDSTSAAITNGYGVNISSPMGGGAITNAYGLRVGAQAVSGVTNAYGVYQAGASDTNYFAGKVGIGTSAPGVALEVKGNVKLTAGSGGSVTFADGTTQTTAWNGVLSGGDYAESVDVADNRHDYAPGDVIVIDPDDPGRFLKSTEPYSTLVAGIYSTKPGLLGRRQGGDLKSSTTEIPMAMVGIVPTRVSAENGAIRAGDLLVTSSMPGVAMKATDRNRMMGAIVGKALASLDTGTGLIEVLVRLQ